MLSKEEIEKIINKTTSISFNGGSCIITREEMHQIKEYIDQLESDKQKLIEKLETDIAEYPEAKYTKWYLCDLLKILKGEKNE